MKEDKFLKVMLFGSPFKKKLMEHPLLGYALVGYSLGFWGYSAYRVVKEYFEIERLEEIRYQEARRRHEERVAKIMADARTRNRELWDKVTDPNYMKGGE